MLAISNIVTSYGGIVAVRGVTIDVAERSIVAIIGPNGAGKTTLLNTASGFLKPLSGSVVLDGENLTALAPNLVATRGLIQVPEGRQVLGPMTVAENLDLGGMAIGRRKGRNQLDHVYQLFPILAERRSQLAGSLSGGQQQMLAIGRAMMGCPRLLMLDEPSLGLSPLVANDVFKALSALNADGLPILLVEQNARKALALASYAYVMERGQIVRHGASAELANDPGIIAHYLGT